MLVGRARLTASHQPINYTNHDPESSVYVHEPQPTPGSELTLTDRNPSPTDAEVLWVRQRTVFWLNTFTEIMNLHDWKIALTFERNALDHWSPQAAFKVEMDGWPYKHLSITGYIGVIFDYRDDQIRHDIVHELCHVLVRPIQDWVPDQEDAHFKPVVERSVEEMARAFIIAYTSKAEDLVELPE